MKFSFKLKWTENKYQLPLNNASTGKKKQHLKNKAVFDNQKHNIDTKCSGDSKNVPQKVIAIFAAYLKI